MALVLLAIDTHTFVFTRLVDVGQVLPKAELDVHVFDYKSFT